MLRRFLPLQWLLSLIFSIQLYIAMAIIGIGLLIPTLIDRRYAHTACRSFCLWAQYSLSIICGVKCEVRGTPPQHEVLVAGKHQSFLDIIMIFGALPRGKFIMKRELLWAPVLGWYALRIGCVPVNRGKRGVAILKMMSDVRSGASMPGQLIIYPQGTRVAPGVVAPYKAGTAALYNQLGQECVPVAVNVGLFWPKRGVLRRPGVAVVEFLPPLPPGLDNQTFMTSLERAIEPASDKLMAEAGFRV